MPAQAVADQPPLQDRAAGRARQRAATPPGRALTHSRPHAKAAAAPGRFGRPGNTLRSGMSEQGGSADPVAEAAARLEAAVERLAAVLGNAFAAGRPAGTAGAEGETVPRAEVAALADRLDATIARLRGALAEDLRRAEEE